MSLRKVTTVSDSDPMVVEKMLFLVPDGMFSHAAPLSLALIFTVCHFVVFAAEVRWLGQCIGCEIKLTKVLGQGSVTGQNQSESEHYNYLQYGEASSRLSKAMLSVLAALETSRSHGHITDCDI